MEKALGSGRLLRAGLVTALVHLILSTGLVVLAGELVSPDPDGGLGGVIGAALLAPLLALIAPSLLLPSLLVAAGLFVVASSMFGQRKAPGLLFVGLGAGLSALSSFGLGLLYRGGPDPDPIGTVVLAHVAEALAGAAAGLVFWRALRGASRASPTSGRS